MKNQTTLFAVCLISSLVPGYCHAQDSKPATTAKPRIVSRVFWQDTNASSIRCADLQRGDQWKLVTEEVAGLPKLDSESSFVQMEEVDGVLVAGVHDQQDGALQSGWLAIDTGVVKDEHGDHFHWKFQGKPRVAVSKLDTQQGNPAHVYQYDNQFFLANDKLNGFTVLDPVGLKAGKPAAKFISAGGGHITIAASENKVAYATWIDREGDNQGRVDVVPLTDSGKPGYSIHLPSGGIHGATANSGRVFFAPADGICWTDADPELVRKQNVTINHLSLGADANGKPYRAGAFTNHLNCVLFVTGSGKNARLCMIDARSPKPAIVSLSLDVPNGATVTPPVVARTAKGKHFAFVFQESTDGQVPERLLVIDLDTNGDNQLNDMTLKNSIEVGASQIQGHNGHHELTTTASGRIALISNPGSNSIWLLDLSDLTIQARFSVSGSPGRLIAVGG